LSGDQYLEEERNSDVGSEEKASGAGEVSEVKKETKRKDVENENMEEKEDE
jgi:hypothetical protein